MVIRSFFTLFLVTASTLSAQTSVTDKTLARIPDYIVYEMFFRHVVALDQFGSVLEAKGQSSLYIRSTIKNATNLSMEEDRLLRQVAANCLNALMVVDKQRGVILKAAKDSHSFSDADRSTVEQLQRQRGIIVNDYLKQLKQAFGKTSFGTLDSYVQTTEAPHITTGYVSNSAKQN